jgi:hypothetical protein
MKGNTVNTLILLFLIMIQFSCIDTGSGIFEYDLIAVEKNDKWGYIDHTGTYVINPQFQEAYAFSDGLALVRLPDDMYGYINKNGKYVIDPIYSNGTYFNGGLAFVVTEYGYPVAIDKKGKTKFELKEAKKAFAFQEGLAQFAVKDKSEYKYGYVDKTGKVQIPAQFSDAGRFCEGLAVISMEGKNERPNYGFIDKTGKIVISPQFMSAGDFHEGLSPVYDGGKYGYINTEGKYVINPQFESASNFSEGLAAVRQERSWGYIDKKGKYAINPQFEEVHNFKHGVAAVSAGRDKYGIIDKEGKYTVNPQFDGAIIFESKFSAVGINDKIGFIDGEGKYIVNPQFEGLQFPSDQISSERDYERRTKSHVISNYYNTSGFIEEFFKRAGDKKFDDFNSATSLQDILITPAYSSVKDNDRYNAGIYKSEDITDEISLERVTFSFVEPLYEYQTVYEQTGYSSYPRQQKEYQLSAKLGSIEYSFNLSGDARSKGITVANAIKAGIESRYNVKMEKGENVYYIDKSDNSFGFVIKYGGYGVSLQVVLTKVKTDNISSATYAPVQNKPVTRRVRVATMGESLPQHSLPFIINDSDGWTNIRQEMNSQSQIVGKVYDYEVFFFTGSNLSGYSNWIPVIAGQKRGYMHRKLILQLDKLPSLRENQTINSNHDVLSNANDTLSVSLYMSPFDQTKHTITHTEGEYVRIDGYDFSKMPSHEIKAIEIISKGIRTVLPNDELKDLYNPHTMRVYIGPKGELYLNICGGIMDDSGQGIYSVWLSIVNKSIMYKLVTGVSTEEFSEQAVKPGGTVGTLGTAGNDFLTELTGLNEREKYEL